MEPCVKSICTRRSKAFTADEYIDIWECLKSPNPIGDLWGTMARRVCSRGRHATATDELEVGIRYFWRNIALSPYYFNMFY